MPIRTAARTPVNPATDYAAALARMVSGINAARPDHLQPLLDCVDPQIRFEDPINRTNGVDKFRQVMLDTWKGFPGSRFVVRTTALVGNTAFIRWSLVREKDGREISLIEATGHTLFGADGRVIHHVDYWDPVAAIYRHIPVIGWILNRIRSSASAGWEKPLR
jgi:steroid Delta-isomerase